MAAVASAAALVLDFKDAPTSYSTLAISAVRTALTMTTVDNPLVWSFSRGKHNAQADMEGPFYVIGAPSRQISDGKAIMASQAVLEKYLPYLLTLRVLSPDGAPLALAKVDLWQANTEGAYSFASYELRGTAMTDADGRLEILSVTPGAYGPVSNIRAGHFHIMVSPSQKDASKYDAVTTQLYVCHENDSSGMKTDFLNYVRKAREMLALQSWSIASAHDGKAFMGFSELSATDAETAKSVAWWNSKLAEKSDLRIVAGATYDMKLSAKAGWF